MDSLLQDIRFGIRTLLKRPGFTAVVVLTLGLGIGANTLIFSVVNAVLLRPLPYKDPDRLVSIFGQNVARGVSSGGVSQLDLVDWKEQNSVFESIAGFDVKDINVTAGTQPERV